MLFFKLASSRPSTAPLSSLFTSFQRVSCFLPLVTTSSNRSPINTTRHEHCEIAHQRKKRQKAKTKIFGLRNGLLELLEVVQRHGLLHRLLRLVHLLQPNSSVCVC